MSSGQKLIIIFDIADVPQRNKYVHYLTDVSRGKGQTENSTLTTIICSHYRQNKGLSVLDLFHYAASV